jgi:DNA-binding transcriptional MocR family regulator
LIEDITKVGTMLLLKLDRNADAPMYLQIVEQVQNLVENGTLRVGAKLPPTRSLAEALGVNRSTVYRAYEELWALGYVEGRPGSYSRVRERPRVVADENEREPDLIDWAALSPASVQSLHERFPRYLPEGHGSRNNRIIDFSRLDMDGRLIPAEPFRKAVNRALYRNGHNVLHYSHYAGYPPLRGYIAQRLRVHGVSISANEILITNGSQHALDLVIRLLAKPGSSVIVEAPTYANMLPLLELHDVRAVGIPMDDEGLDLEVLASTLRIERPAFVYTMPNFQNPTGITTSQEHREELLAICERYGVPIVEDGFEEEMKYFGKVALPIKSMDHKKIVIYLGTFSKVLMPGVRIGWVAASSGCIERLMVMKRFADISSNSLSQAAVHEFCEEGLYELHIRRMHRVYRKRMQTMLDSLSRYMPGEHVSWTKPNGGYLLWVRLQNTVDDAALYEALRTHGIVVSQGKFYFAHPAAEPCFRLSIAALDEDEIVEGTRRLGAAISSILSR